MITIADLQSSETIVEDLDWAFDFSLEQAAEEAEGIQLSPEQSFTVIAGEGSGGVFLAYGEGAPESLPILHGSSEGQAGRVAANLTEWLAILMALPYWSDLLKFSAGGQLSEMRKAASLLESEYQNEEDYADLLDARQRIMRALPIPSLDDPIKVLHASVRETDCFLIAEDGQEYESLFNTFKTSDNPAWR